MWHVGGIAGRVPERGAAGCHRWSVIHVIQLGGDRPWRRRHSHSLVIHSSFIRLTYGG